MYLRCINCGMGLHPLTPTDTMRMGPISLAIPSPSAPIEEVPEDEIPAEVSRGMLIEEVDNDFHISLFNAGETGDGITQHTIEKGDKHWKQIDSVFKLLKDKENGNI